MLDAEPQPRVQEPAPLVWCCPLCDRPLGNISRDGFRADLCYRTRTGEYEADCFMATLIKHKIVREG